MGYRYSYEEFTEIIEKYESIFGEAKLGTEEYQFNPDEYIDILKKCIETNKPIEHYYALPDPNLDY